MLTYFHQSEQVPTGIRSAVAFDSTADAWRAAAVIVQAMPGEGAVAESEREDDWRRTMLLLDTLSDAELLDPGLGPDTLLYRLFHEDGVRVFDSLDLRFGCSCDEERVRNMLKQFERDEVLAMPDDSGKVTVDLRVLQSRLSLHTGRDSGPFRGYAALNSKSLLALLMLVGLVACGTTEVRQPADVISTKPPLVFTVAEITFEEPLVPETGTGFRDRMRSERLADDDAWPSCNERLQIGGGTGWLQVVIEQARLVEEELDAPSRRSGDAHPRAGPRARRALERAARGDGRRRTGAGLHRGRGAAPPADPAQQLGHGPGRRGRAADR